MDGENSVVCHNCDESGATKTPSISKFTMLNFPEYLIVIIKLFKQVNKDGIITMDKIHHKIKTQFALNIDNKQQYLLLTAIVHQGESIEKGHYIQIGRSVTDCNRIWNTYRTETGSIESRKEDFGNWIYSSDQNKHPVMKRRVKGFLGDSGKRSGKKGTTPYMLIYKRYDNEYVNDFTIPRNMPNIPLNMQQSDNSNTTTVSISNTSNENDNNHHLTNQQQSMTNNLNISFDNVENYTSMPWTCPQCSQIQFDNQCVTCKLSVEEADRIRQEMYQETHKQLQMIHEETINTTDVNRELSPRISDNMPLRKKKLKKKQKKKQNDKNIGNKSRKNTQKQTQVQQSIVCNEQKQGDDDDDIEMERNEKLRTEIIELLSKINQTEKIQKASQINEQNNNQQRKKNENDDDIEMNQSYQIGIDHNNEQKQEDHNYHDDIEMNQSLQNSNNIHNQDEIDIQMTLSKGCGEIQENNNGKTNHEMQIDHQSTGLTQEFINSFPYLSD